MNFVKKFIATKLLDFHQKRIDNLYKFEGPSDRVLKKQLALNRKRNKLNISDASKRVYKEYVQ